MNNNAPCKTKTDCRWSFDPIFECPYDSGPDDSCFVFCGCRRIKMKEHYDSSSTKVKTDEV